VYAVGRTLVVEKKNIATALFILFYRIRDSMALGRKGYTRYIQQIVTSRLESDPRVAIAFFAYFVHSRVWHGYFYLLIYL